MQRKFMTPTLFGLLWLTAGDSQAQSSVTVYGVMDAAITSSRSDHGQRATKLDSGIGPGGRLGFRGTEDLGNGLRANFVLESGIALDTGTYQQGGLPFGRQAFVGLSSTAGWSLGAGRQYSPMALSLVSADAQANAYWGNLLSVGNGLYPSPGATGSDPGFQATNRVSNSVAASWTGGAYTVRAMLAAGDENTRRSGQVASASVSYEAGPLALTAAGVRSRQFAKDIDASGDPAWQNEAMVGGSYDFQAVKLFTGVYGFDPSERNKTVSASTMTKTWSAWLGARVPLASGTLIGQAIRTLFDFPSAAGRANSLSVAYEYPLSKRTVLYGSAGRVINNSRGVAVMYATGPILNLPAVAGADPQAVSLGVRHSF